MSREDTRQTLLDAGSDLIGSKGYNGVGLKEILDRVAVPKGSFYHYFKSKEDFAIEVLEINFAEKHAFLSSHLDNREFSPLKRISNLLQEYKKQKYLNDCLIVKMTTEMADLSRPIKECLERGAEESRKILYRCLEAARDAGEIDASHDLEDLCEFIFSGWEGALLRYRLTGSLESIDIFGRYLITLITKL